MINLEISSKWGLSVPKVTAETLLRGRYEREMGDEALPALHMGGTSLHVDSDIITTLHFACGRQTATVTIELV